MEKRVVKFWCGAAFALLCVLALGGCGKKSDPAEVAQRFFASLAANNIEAAYAEGAFGFQAEQSQVAFAHNVNQLGLNRQKAIHFDPPEIRNDEVHVPVEVTNDADAKLPFVVTLVRESGQWRIFSLRSPRSAGRELQNRFSLVGKGAAFSDAQSQLLPNEADLDQLVRTTMRRFDDAVQEKSFANFYETVAVAWRRQLTVAQLDRAFASFIESAVKISGLDDAKLELDGPPAISPEGVLIVNGRFDTAPYRVHFNMKFIYERPWWKLFGIDVRLLKE